MKSQETIEANKVAREAYDAWEKLIEAREDLDKDP